MIFKYANGETCFELFSQQIFGIKILMHLSYKLANEQVKAYQRNEQQKLLTLRRNIYDWGFKGENKKSQNGQVQKERYFV